MLAIGSDHAGYNAKEKLKGYLKALAIFKDFGAHSEKSCDYPLIAEAVAKSVASGESEGGILICGSGIGMCIAANKICGIRAAVCNDVNLAKLARSHNDINVICLGSRIIEAEKMENVVKTFLKTPFEGQRHQRRVDEIKRLENL